MKIHRTPDGNEVLAICDRELLNTRISYHDITFHVSEAFYGSTVSSEEEVRMALRRADNINLVGERAVTLAIETGLTTRESCMMLGSVPHVQIFGI